jgi:hypothetical protein
MTFIGGLATINLIAEPEHRAQDVAVFLACAYARPHDPGRGGRTLEPVVGTKDATLYCAIVIGGLAMIAVAVIRHCRDVM